MLLYLVESLRRLREADKMQYNSIILMPFCAKYRTLPDHTAGYSFLASRAETQGENK